MTMIQPQRDRARVVTGEVRLSYAHLWEPRASQDEGDPKYGTCILIPKTDTATISAIEEAIQVAVANGKAKHGAKFNNPGALKLPLRDGDVERPDDPVYQGHFFINANSKSAPQIVNAQGRYITDQDEVYSGCYGRVSVEFFPFNFQGKAGIGAGLGNVQKLRDGEKLSGGATAAEDFGAPEDVEDDFLN